jgi:hypothetical protein
MVPAKGRNCGSSLHHRPWRGDGTKPQPSLRLGFRFGLPARARGLAASEPVSKDRQEGAAEHLPSSAYGTSATGTAGLTASSWSVPASSTA